MAIHPHRVAIVGAGAAGLSAAYALSKHPDKFSITVFEKEPVPGGMASSMDIDYERYGASHINDGVQGCSPAFANTLRIFRDLDFPPEKVDMQCASRIFSRFTFSLSLFCFCFAFFPRLYLQKKKNQFWQRRKLLDQRLSLPAHRAPRT
jgi:predicted NAD/FAD-binding protein